MKIIVVGAGPAGMMAAITAAQRPGNEVILLERNNSIGRKLFITGKGRCNVTNARDISEFFDAVPRNPEFLYSAFYSFTNEALMQWLKERGLKLKVERGGRVFPESDKSSDVISVFRRELDRAGVEVRYGAHVTGIMREGRRITGLKTSQGNAQADHYILAGGGASYPLTGSDGSILAYLKRLGIKTHEFLPSLISLTVAEAAVADLAGVSLRNVGFTLKEGKRVLFQDLGEMLFTHNGVSGPLVLSASCLRTDQPMTCAVDLKPGLTKEELDLRILRDFSASQNKCLANGLGTLLIQRLIPFVLARAEVDPDKKVHSVTKAERQSIVSVIKQLEFSVTGTRPLAEAIISRGGVDVNAIDPSTMKLVEWPQISVCGELIDVDGFTGGFNLQIAFSTGYLAGANI